jgi:hypothetical protein
MWSPTRWLVSRPRSSPVLGLRPACGPASPLRGLLVLVRVFLIGVLAAVPLACAQVVANTSSVEVAGALAECQVGSQGCSCTGGGGCDPGLYCDSGICVGDSYGGEEYLFEDDMLEAEILAPAPAPMRTLESMPGVASKSSGRERRSQRNAGRGKLGKSIAADAPAAAAPEGSVTAPTLTVDDALALTPAEPNDPADAPELVDARQVIYMAVMVLSVFDIDAVAELLEGMPQRYGGWIESRFDYQITLRIRAERLFEAMDQLAELGIVLDKSLLAEDVTAEYIDLESRIRVLEQIVARLEALLAKATTVEEALQIRLELDRMRLELESARVRMRALAESIDFSTLTVVLTPRGPEQLLPSSNDPFPWVNEMGIEAVEYR